MPRATTVIRKPAVRADRIADTIVLDHHGRYLRRAALTGEGGLAFTLELETETALNDGDALKLEDGRLVQVRAAPEHLLEITAENPARLTRLAWQLGGRHVPVEVTAAAIFIKQDAALGELARGQGCTAAAVTRPFQPEREAAGHACDHDHHAEGHSAHHHHAHEHGHAHGHEHGHGGCGCGHSHGH